MLTCAMGWTDTLAPRPMQATTMFSMLHVEKMGVAWGRGQQTEGLP